MKNVNPGKEYYNVQDVMTITGLKKSKCYDIIRRLNDSFQKNYPNSMVMKGKIPIWYFKKKMRCEEVNGC